MGCRLFVGASPASVPPPPDPRSDRSQFLHDLLSASQSRQHPKQFCAAAVERIHRSHLRHHWRHRSVILISAKNLLVRITPMLIRKYMLGLILRIGLLLIRTGLLNKPITYDRRQLAGASIPPETMKHSPLFQKLFRLPRKISQVTLLCVTFPPPKHSFHPPKFMMTFFSHRLKTQNF